MMVLPDRVGPRPARVGPRPVGVDPRADRPASGILHDEPSVRVVSFHLRPGQRIAPHRSESTVVVHVVEGAGTFRGETDAALLGPGESAVFAPGEVHSIEAHEVPLEFLAFIAPRPGG